MVLLLPVVCQVSSQSLHAIAGLMMMIIKSSRHFNSLKVLTTHTIIFIVNVIVSFSLKSITNVLNKVYIFFWLIFFSLLLTYRSYLP
jgi:hypothetical protein